MLRSMYSAVSGLRNHQIMLDVVGNNIANVNTFGFKAGRAVFEDNLSQLVRGGSAPVPNTGTAGSGIGGMNPAQVGLGVRLGAITNLFSQGGLQVTNQTTDLAIQGDGFFVVQKAGANFYTRNGAFNFDTDGNLVTSSGNYVQGWMATDDKGTMPATTDKSTMSNITLPTSTQSGAHGKLDSFQIDQDGSLVGSYEDGQVVKFGQIALSNFNNPPGLEKVGGSMYKETLNSGTPDIGLPAQGGHGTVQSGTLEMSNVDLAQEFTQLIVAQRGFQANSKVVTTSDEVLNDLIQMKR